MMHARKVLGNGIHIAVKHKPMEGLLCFDVQTDAKINCFL